MTKILWQGCWNCNPCFLRNWLRNTGFFFEEHSYMVKSSIQKFSEFFSGTKQEVFSFLAKKGRVVKTVFLLSTGAFYGKQLSSKVFWFLVMFVPRATIYCFFAKKNPWSLLKLHSMCREKHFDKNFLNLKKV